MPFSRYSSDTEQESPETKYWRQAKNKSLRSKLTVNEGKVSGCDTNSACMDAYDKMYDHYDRKQNYLNNPVKPRIDTRQSNPDYINQDFAYPTRNIIFDHSFNSQTTPGNIDNYVMDYDNTNMPNENRIYQRFSRSNYGNYDQQYPQSIQQPQNTSTDLFMRHQVAINPLYGGNVAHFGMTNPLTKKSLSMNDIEAFMRILLFIVIAVYFSILIIKSCKFNDNPVTNTTDSQISIPPGLPNSITMFKT